MIGQRETGARRIAGGIGMQVDADFVFRQIAQQPGKDFLRLGQQALPVGGVMAPKFGADILCIPADQRLAQLALGLVLPAFAVDMFQPAFQRIGGLPIQPAQQHGLPVVPGAGADTADIADRQHRQQIQPLAGFHRLGEIAYRARIADIALLRHVGHQQVIAHQPFDGFTFFLCQPQTRRDPAGNLGAEDRMIFGAALADIMQQKRHIQNPAADPGFEDRGGQRQFLDQLAPLDLRQGRDALDDVFIHRIVVIDVELHHRHDGFEFRDEGAQHAQFVHPAQAAFGIAVFQQQIQKDALRLGRVAHVIVDEVQIGGDQAHHIGMHQIAGAQPFFEDAQQVQLVGQKLFGIDGIYAALHQFEAGAHFLAAAEHADQACLGLGMAGFQLGQEHAGQLTHAGRMAEVILHEDLDRAAAATVGIAHAGRNLDLQIERQLIHRAFADVMQVAAHCPEEVFGAAEGGVFIMGQQARLHQTRGIRHPVQIFADPVERLQITQAALALFHVGLQHIALPALAFMAFGAFLQLGFDEFGAGIAEEF